MSGGSPFDILFSLSIPRVLTNIFLLVEPDDLDACRLVCKRWNQFIGNHILGSLTLRERVLSQRLALLWKRENFTEHHLQLKGKAKKEERPDAEEWRKRVLEVVFLGGFFFFSRQMSSGMTWT